MFLDMKELVFRLVVGGSVDVAVMVRTTVIMMMMGVT